MNAAEIQSWAQACRQGDRRAASRLISLLESSDLALATAASEAVAHFDRPKQTLGITGPPGAGKSTLVDYLAGLYRARGERVAILAIDPSSPFTGGALLGDRIRMSTHRGDSGVFIRSMGSRGAGGLALAASDALRTLAAAGYGIAIIETVGAGQSEIDIGHLADTVCLVQVPGLGDDIQLMKMGQLEIADVFAVNKADRPGAEELKIELELAIQSIPGRQSRTLRRLSKTEAAASNLPDWKPPVRLLSALERRGGEALLSALDEHLSYVRQPNLSPLIRRQRIEQDILWRAGIRFQRELAKRLDPGGDLAETVDAVLNGKLSPIQAVAKALGAHG